MNLNALEAELTKGLIGTVVVTLGTTAAGRIDPLPEVLSLQKRYDFRLHVDAAYGGYFTLASNLTSETRKAFDLIHEADSIVIDPHKHGLQPYGCGCILFRDPEVGRFYKHNSPYTYFSSSELHLGEISLECSRAGAAAVALWTTLRLLPLELGGEFAQSLTECREGALALYHALKDNDRFAPLYLPEIDIVVWAVRASSATQSSLKARQIFDACAARDLHFALSTFPRMMMESAGPVRTWDGDEITCLRACVMKPEHREWIHVIVEKLQECSRAVEL
jgi:glutamate/tyrosine decarboxylase-like PLP-dependent enzyme